MNIYTQQSRWKLILVAAGIVIILVSLIYTNQLASSIAVQEETAAENWVYAQEIMTSLDDEDDLNCDYTLHQKIFTSNNTIPVILTYTSDGTIQAKNYGKYDDDIEYLKARKEKLQRDGVEPIDMGWATIYYEESLMLRQLRFFPYIQLALITAFILFGYFSFNAAKRAEQNRVWAGMAKETAHQLGTPISAILAWIEHLRLVKADDQEVKEVLDELENDVDRLNLIADRFSKIGSTPKLESINILEELEKCRIYMQRRASKHVKFDFPKNNGHPIPVKINPPLFDWVIENLMRNALDAMSSKGKISAHVYDDKDYVYLDLSDTGKGIPNGKFKTIFRPGYTTKKRGWGLGLSLAKRIIEQYHSGKIFVKSSIEGKGTTFTIQLPKKNTG